VESVENSRKPLILLGFSAFFDLWKNCCLKKSKMWKSDDLSKLCDTKLSEMRKMTKIEKF